MRKLFYSLVIMVVFLIVSSCGSKSVYEKHRSVGENYSWNKTEALIFEPTIDDVSKKYDIIFSFRHVHGFPYRNLMISVKMKNPEGKLSFKEYSIVVFNDQNEYISECAGDYCDLDQVIEHDFVFEKKGTYTFEISQNMSSDTLRSVMEVGLIIRSVN